MFLEAVTALQLEDARHLWRRFQESLVAHLAFEDEVVLPLLQSHLADEDKRPDHMAGDHVIVGRALARSENALTALAAAPDRRQLVTLLDDFLWIGRVLEHHTARELRQIYPALESALTADSAQHVRIQMVERHTSAPSDVMDAPHAGEKP